MTDESGLAKCLAEVVSNCGMLDIASLEAKIKAALIVMSPPEGNNGREISKLQKHINDVKSRGKDTNSRLNEEIKFWKNKARDRMDDWQIKESYDELNEILEKNGYKVKG